jgi:4a-hydroxytetrahydrobiopterin dehydratase
MSWNIENNRLTKQFEFKTQTQLCEFLLKVAQQADQIGHHPDMSIYKCSKLKIELITHDQGKITELDYKLARIIDVIIN